MILNTSNSLVQIIHIHNYKNKIRGKQAMKEEEIFKQELVDSQNEVKDLLDP